jgi:hypothetical protein
MIMYCWQLQPKCTDTALPGLQGGRDMAECTVKGQQRVPVKATQCSLAEHQQRLLEWQ